MEYLYPNKDIKKHHLLYFPHRAPSIQQLEKKMISTRKRNNGSILTEVVLFSDQEKKIRERINLTLTPTLSLMVWAWISILRKGACVHKVNLSICISCMCVTKLVKVILIWKTKTIKIQEVQINHRVSKVKSTINQF